jgi:Fe2+ transport system protein FeoA
VGALVRVVGLECPVADAARLRVLGVFEGAHVSIVERRGGLLLDVRGSRLALDAAVAMTIIAASVRP